MNTKLTEEESRVPTLLIKINRFFYEEETNVVKLHLSHSDADGCGCIVLSKYLLSHQYAKSSIRFRTTPDVNGVPNFIRKFIDEELKKNPKAKFKFLITDLGSVDPETFVFPDVSFELIVIDHHVVNSAKHKRLIDSEWSTGISCEHLNPTRIYYSFSDASATYLFHKILMQMLKIYNIGSINDFVKIQPYVDRISAYDTGEWGTWTDTESNAVIDEQLAFGYFVADQDSEDQINQYIDYVLKTFSIINTDYNLGDYFVKLEFNQLVDEYKHFLASMKITNYEYQEIMQIDSDAAASIKIPVSFKVGINTIETEKDKLKYFSLISKRVLEDQLDIDFLCVYEKFKGRVQLRSAKDSVNVAKIAFANGGGGHPRAAGFPVNHN